MTLLSLSDVATAIGGKYISAEDIVIPKKYYEKLLANCPITKEKVRQWFISKPRVRAVVIKELDDE